MSRVLTIGVLAARTGCSVPTIRHYEAIGLLPRASRRPGGHRIYTETDVTRLAFIRRWRSLGLPIARLGDLLGLAVLPERNCIAARDLAQRQLEQVREKLAELRVVERSLALFVERCTAACAGGPVRECVILEDLAAPEKSACCGSRS